MKLHINQSLSAYDSCSKPCTEVTYSFSAEPFTAMTPSELSLVSQCSWTPSPSLLTIQVSRRVTVEYEDYVTAANTLTARLREEGCEVVIALTHMRTPNDIRLAENVNDIDIILGGHDHVYEAIKVS